MPPESSPSAADLAAAPAETENPGIPVTEDAVSESDAGPVETVVDEVPGVPEPIPESSIANIDAASKATIVSDVAVPATPRETIVVPVNPPVVDRPAKVVFAKPAVVSVPVDSEKESAIAQQIVTTLRDSAADITGVAKEVAQNFADIYAPQIARQAILATSSDPVLRAKAENNLAHLKATVILKAAAAGIPLQQRQEGRLLDVVATVLNMAIGLLK